MNVTAIANHIAASLRAGSVREEPWHHVIVNEVLPSELYVDLLTTKPDWRIRQKAREGVGKCRRAVWLLNKAQSPPWTLVRDALTTRAVSDAFCEATGAPRGYAEPRINVDKTGYQLGSHSDDELKTGVFVIYLTESDCPDFGLRVSSADKQSEAKLPFTRNGGYAFKRTKYAVHSVDRVDGTRRTLMVPFFFQRRDPWLI